jgi:hypothetical protein
MHASHQKRPALAVEQAVTQMIAIAIITIALGASFFFETQDYREGPVAIERGTVKTISMDTTSAYRLPREVVTVRLAGGPTVIATAPRGLPIRSGAIVIVDVYRYHLTGVRTYRIHHFAVAPMPSRP